MPDDQPFTLHITAETIAKQLSDEAGEIEEYEALYAKVKAVRGGVERSMASGIDWSTGEVFVHEFRTLLSLRDQVLPHIRTQAATAGADEVVDLVDDAVAQIEVVIKSDQIRPT